LLDAPELFISIDNTLQNENEFSNLTYGQTYLLTCVAKDSRPAVELNFYAFSNNLMSLEEYGNNTVSNVQRKVDCNSNSICTTILSLSLIINDERLKATKKIICEAKNTTIPFVLSANTTLFVTVTEAKG
jgi:hypothetical protein